MDHFIEAKGISLTNSELLKWESYPESGYFIAGLGNIIRFVGVDKINGNVGLIIPETIKDIWAQTRSNPDQNDNQQESKALQYFKYSDDMQIKDEHIEQIASCLGMSYADAEAKFNSFANLGQPALNAAEAMNNLNTAMERLDLPPRRKNSNYTKPRNRKKKPKNKRR